MTSIRFTCALGAPTRCTGPSQLSRERAAMDVELGVIGGSGLYRLRDDAQLVEVETPYGPTSGQVAIGTLVGPSGAYEVAILLCHGLAHQWPPHLLNYRANVWVLHLHRGAPDHRAVYVRVAARGDEARRRRDLRPLRRRHVGAAGHVLRRTTGEPPRRAGSVLSRSGCRRRPGGRSRGLRGASCGTVVVIPGPRFATRAESATYRTFGYDVINMTQCPTGCVR